MIIEYYPRTLPQPVRDGYTGTPYLKRRRMLMDDGFYWEGRQFDRQPFKYTLNWKFTFEQLKRFEGWFEHYVLNRTKFFRITFGGSEKICKPCTNEPLITHNEGTWSVTLEVSELQASPDVVSISVLPLWPAELPTFENRNYSYTRGETFLVEEMAGHTDLRNRFKNKLTKFTGTIILTPEERQIFWDFYRDQLINGAAWFQAPFDNGFGSTMVRAKFADNLPTESPLGAIYSLQLQLETSNAPIYTFNEYQATAIFVHDYIVEGYFDEGYIGHYE